MRTSRSEAGLELRISSALKAVAVCTCSLSPAPPLAARFDIHTAKRPIPTLIVAMISVVRMFPMPGIRKRAASKRSRGRAERIQCVEDTNLAFDVFNPLRKEARQDGQRTAHQKRRNDQYKKARCKADAAAPAGIEDAAGAIVQ